MGNPEEFANWKQEAHKLGIEIVESGPLVRSSYHAEEQSAQFAKDLKASARSFYLLPLSSDTIKSNSASKPMYFRMPSHWLVFFIQNVQPLTQSLLVL